MLHLVLTTNLLTFQALYTSNTTTIETRSFPHICFNQRFGLPQTDLLEVGQRPETKINEENKQLISAL